MKSTMYILTCVSLVEIEVVVVWNAFADEGYLVGNKTKTKWKICEAEHAYLRSSGSARFPHSDPTAIKRVLRFLPIAQQKYVSSKYDQAYPENIYNGLILHFYGYFSSISDVSVPFRRS